MKKLLANKKVLLAGIVAGAIALSAGTYAWFTQQATAAATNATMGRLHIDATSNLDSDAGVIYEPGQTIELEYTFANPSIWSGTKTIDALVEIPLYNATVDYWSDYDGNPAGPWLDEPINPSHVGFNVDESQIPVMGVFEDAEGNQDVAYMWLKTAEATPRYFLWINSGAQAEISADVTFKGSAMGNEYQGAVFHFVDDFKAGQLVEFEDENTGLITESAVYDTFGVYLADLDFIDGDWDPAIVTPASAGVGTQNNLPRNAAEARQWLLDRAAGK